MEISRRREIDEQKISTQLFMLIALVCFIQRRDIVVYSEEALVGM